MPEIKVISVENGGKVAWVVGDDIYYATVECNGKRYSASNYDRHKALEDARQQALRDNR